MSSTNMTMGELIDLYASIVGHRAPEITDKIMPTLCPETMEAADEEGVLIYLRDGIMKAVREHLKRGKTKNGSKARDFADVEPSFKTILCRLNSQEYYVEQLQRHVDIEELIDDLESLCDAEQHMRRKGRECIAEADKLNELILTICKVRGLKDPREEDRE